MQQAPLIKEYLDIAFRRRWWIIIPTLVGILFSIAFYFRVDKKYMAETRVQTRPQTISQALLRPIVESNPQDEITTITAEITSEPYMRELDAELNLVGSPGGPKDLQELAKILDGSITLNANPRNRYFDLKVSWGDPRVAAAIANKLAEIYIARYSELRRDLATGTLAELKANTDEIEEKLQDVRDRIERFRSEHKFELDTSADDNRLEYQANLQEIGQLESQIRDARNELDNLNLMERAGITSVDPTGVVVNPQRERLAEQRRRYDDLRAQGRSDEHPEVRKVLAEIERLEAIVGSEDPVGDSTSDQISPAELDRLQLQQRRETFNEQIRIAEARIEQLREKNNEIQLRLDRTPDNVIQLDRMITLEERFEAEYQSAREREINAQAGALVEELGKGEKFDVLNRARPNNRPYFPDIKLFLFMGFAVGLGLGVSVVLLLEVFDQSFKSEEQLAASIDLPILAVIPDLTRVADQAQRRRQAQRRGA